MIVRCLLLCVLWPTGLLAQGFAGLGGEATGFSVPERGYGIQFPQDHGAHSDFRIEWWYLTANLKDASGRDYGVQWTLFRSALAPETRQGWNDPQIWFAHAAVTTADAHLVAERVARGGIGQAGVTAVPFSAWIDDWTLAGPDLDALQVTARGGNFQYNLDLVAKGPLVFHGDGGFSVKSAQGQASYYYSQPFFEVTGILDLPEGAVAVTGQAWLDREWSSQPLAEDQTGWDWFSLSFDTGDKLMGFQLRNADRPGFTAATWITPDGRTTAFQDGAFSAEPMSVSQVAGRDVPTEWRVQLPARGIDVTVTALNPSAWMAVSLPYWEGPVHVKGTHQGIGYLEMTGYE